MSIRQINRRHRFSIVKYIVKSHNMFGIYHRMRFFRYHSTITKEPSLCYDYNKRGTAEQVFDRQNNDFGWAHLPKSFMNQNTVFLLITAMAANFYRYIVALPLMALIPKRTAMSGES